ncbi:hypothetical protein GE061_007502 [Apolygus lucorum]|uniref:Uncharacterized protein n=1 Tax=Apolygus lucorum TaxID=248454 RepID=A0A8S9WUH1_APOLU|nr:hypothetical protein GE061_007502 [Apolygus lucorum]
MTTEELQEVLDDPTEELTEEELSELIDDHDKPEALEDSSREDAQKPEEHLQNILEVPLQIDAWNLRGQSPLDKGKG